MFDDVSTEKLRKDAAEANAAYVKTGHSRCRDAALDFEAEIDRREQAAGFALTGDTLERLAEAVHKVWMDGKLRDGWAYAPDTDKAAKLHACMVPYADLSEADKESDRDQVRGIPAILAEARLTIAERWYLMRCVKRLETATGEAT